MTMGLIFSIPRLIKCFSLLILIIAVSVQFGSNPRRNLRVAGQTEKNYKETINADGLSGEVTTLF